MGLSGVRHFWRRSKRHLAIVWRCVRCIISVVQFLSPCALCTRWCHRRYGSRYTLDADGSVTYRRTLWSDVEEYLRKDSPYDRKLMARLQKMIPTFKIVDFNNSWTNGIAICALIESRCPGACPRYDLLRKTHKTNNCRLALKIANKHLGIPQNIINAEELSLFSGLVTDKIIRLLSLIMWSSIQRDIHEQYRKNKDKSMGTTATSLLAHKSEPCLVSGCGLEVGLVRKKCNFDVHVPAAYLLELQVAVSTPSGQIYSEKIIRLFPKQRFGSADHFHRDQRAVSLWKVGAAKLLTAGGRKMVASKPLTCTEKTESQRVEIEHETLKEGHIRFSYVPRTTGTYRLVVKWQKRHVRGSPFQVNIANTVEELNQADLKMRNARIALDCDSLAANLETGDSSDSSSDDGAKSDDLQCGAVTAAVLNRTSKVQRSISRIGVPLSMNLSKEATVTRRRVLRRIITSGGQEVVIEEAAPTPILSRETSKGSGDDMKKLIGPNSKSLTPDKLKDAYRSADSVRLSPPCAETRFHCSPFSSHGDPYHEAKDDVMTEENKPRASVRYESNGILPINNETIDSAKPSPTDNSSTTSSTTTLSSGVISHDTSVSMDGGSISTNVHKPTCTYVEGDPGRPDGPMSVHEQRNEVLSLDFTTVEPSLPSQAPEDKTFVHLSNQHSPVSVSPITFSTSIDNCFLEYVTNYTEKLNNGDTDHTKRPALKHIGGAHNRLRGSTSLPALFKRWNAFEIDEDDKLTMSEMEDISIAVQLRQKRATFSTSELCTSQNEFESLIRCTPDVNNKRFLGKHISLGQVFPRSRSSSIEMPLSPLSITENCDDDEVFSDSKILSNCSQQGNCRNVHKLDEDTSLDGCNCEEKDNKGNWSCPNQLVNVLHYTGNYIAQNVLTPTATIDKWTQVANSDIVAVTGWVKPTTFVRPHRRPFYSFGAPWVAIHNFDQYNRSEMDFLAERVRNTPNQTYRIPSSKGMLAIAGKTDFLDGRVPTSTLPIKQATIDTVDSDIVEESSHNRQNLSSEIAITTKQTKHAPRPRLISGHRKISRSRYRGKIPLDPKLTSSTPSNNTNNDNITSPIDTRRKLLRNVKYEKHISRILRSENSMSDKSVNKFRRSTSGLFKRRVRFCKRVLLHRKSSSWSSASRGSRYSSHDSICRSISEPHPITKTIQETGFTHDQFNKRQSDELSITNQQLSSDIAVSERMNETPLDGEENQIKKSQMVGVDNIEADHKESMDDFDGFGVSATTRKDLLDEIDMFSKIGGCSVDYRRRMSAPEQKQATPRMNKVQRSSSEIAYMKISVDNHNVRNIRPDFNILPTHRSSSLLGYDDDICNAHAKTNHEGSQGTISPAASEISHLWKRSPRSTIAMELMSDDETVSWDCHSDEAVQRQDRDEYPESTRHTFGMDDAEEEWHENSGRQVPDPFRCKAYGSGLKYGSVGPHNMFQVCTPTSNNGCLTVGMTGPRRHTVRETSVLFTGDDLYEVTYDVTQPGIYVISVKWCDYHVPNSPFICHVTY